MTIYIDTSKKIPFSNEELKEALERLHKQHNFRPIDPESPDPDYNKWVILMAHAIKQEKELEKITNKEQVEKNNLLLISDEFRHLEFKRFFEVAKDIMLKEKIPVISFIFSKENKTSPLGFTLNCILKLVVSEDSLLHPWPGDIEELNHKIDIFNVQKFNYNLLALSFNHEAESLTKSHDYFFIDKTISFSDFVQLYGTPELIAYERSLNLNQQLENKPQKIGKMKI